MLEPRFRRKNLIEDSSTSKLPEFPFAGKPLQLAGIHLSEMPTRTKPLARRTLP
jgi:hypothetical protein